MRLTPPLSLFSNILLNLATMFESPDVIELLAKAGLDVNAKTSLDETPDHEQALH